MYRDILMVSIVVVLLALACAILLDRYYAPPAHKLATPGVGSGGRSTGPGTTARIRPRPAPDSDELRKPEVLVFTDKAAYSEWLKEMEDEPRVESRPADAVDFDVNQVVAILWGDKPTSGYELTVKSVEIEEQEAIITVATRIPEPGAATLVVTYPGVTATAPRSKRVRVIISGQRMPVVEKFRDFEPSSKPELEVVVKPNEAPKNEQPKSGRE